MEGGLAGKHGKWGGGGHRSANQTSAECCLGFTARGGYRMFLGLSGAALTLPLALGSHDPCTLGLVSMLPHSLWLAGPVLTLSGTQMFVYQKWPESMFPFVNPFAYFLNYEIWAQGGIRKGGRGSGIGGHALERRRGGVDPGGGV